ncbi:hypothetical protein ABC345_06485 [Shouchella sp. 1P09AA]|uniref:hypothetical protein n=1 Tax=unclassified Shouchella TaxID=2893065 RepID=UPI0039A0AAC1
MNRKDFMMFVLFLIGPTIALSSVFLPIEWIARTCSSLGNTMFILTIIFYADIRTALHKKLKQKQ